MWWCVSTHGTYILNKWKVTPNLYRAGYGNNTIACLPKPEVHVHTGWTHWSHVHMSARGCIHSNPRAHSCMTCRLQQDPSNQQWDTFCMILVINSGIVGGIVTYTPDKPQDSSITIWLCEFWKMDFACADDGTFRTAFNQEDTCIVIELVNKNQVERRRIEGSQSVWCQHESK